jgi:multidrug efflux pump subunit AcrA (membrane-fusion protein)
MFARVSIITAVRQQTLLVPREALLTESPDTPLAVITVDDRQTARRSPIKLGLQDERFAEIIEGVNEGQIVITSGQAGLKHGDAVTPQAPVMASEGASYVAH